MILLQPIEKEINGKKFILSKFPALAGHEIVMKYSAAGFPDVKDYQSFEDVVVKLMGFVGIPMAGTTPLTLSTKALIDNHVPDWKTLVEVQKEMMEYNSSFL